jgi:hypothetical protein
LHLLTRDVLTHLLAKGGSDDKELPMKKLAVGLAALAGLALVSTAASAAQAWHGPRDGTWGQAYNQTYNYRTVHDRNAYVYDGSGYRPSTNRFHDNPYVYGNPDRD